MFSNLLNSNAPHSPHSKSTDQRVPLLMGVLSKCVDSHESEVWLGLGVVDDVEVDQLLELDGGSLHALDHVGEQG